LGFGLRLVIANKQFHASICLIFAMPRAGTVLLLVLNVAQHNSDDRRQLVTTALLMGDVWRLTQRCGDGASSGSNLLRQVRRSTTPQLAAAVTARGGPRHTATRRDATRRDAPVSAPSHAVAGLASNYRPVLGGQEREAQRRRRRRQKRRVRLSGDGRPAISPAVGRAPGRRGRRRRAGDIISTVQAPAGSRNYL